MSLDGLRDCLDINVETEHLVDDAGAPFPPDVPPCWSVGVSADLRRLASSCAELLACRCVQAPRPPLAATRDGSGPGDAELLTLFGRVMSGAVDIADGDGAHAAAWMGELRRRADLVVRQLTPGGAHMHQASLSGFAQAMRRGLADGLQTADTRRLQALVVDVHPSALLQRAAPRVAMVHPLFVLAQWQNDCYGSPLWPMLLNALAPPTPADCRLLHAFALFLVLRGLDQPPLHTAPAVAATAAGIDPLMLCARYAQMLDRTCPRFAPEALAHTLGGTVAWQAKRSDGFGERSEPLEVTLARIEPVMHLAGITRVPDITGLDVTGVPAFQCIRPDAQDGDQTFTVFGGKGESPLQCRVSAIAEGIERFCAEDKTHRDQIVSASYRALSATHAVVHPRRFNIPDAIEFSQDEPLEWFAARRLEDGSVCYVPACMVFYPYEPRTGRALTRFFTTGLAAGNDRIEAISHGLAEVIERDAASLNRIVRRFPAVVPDSIDSARAQDLIRRFREASLNVFIRSIAAPDIGIPVFSVILEDRRNPDPLFVSGGYGAHPDKEVALINALTEAALSRSGTISGAREDLAKFRNARDGISYEEFRKRYHYWFSTEPAVDYDRLPTYRMPIVVDDLCVMANHVHAAGLHDLLWVNLSKPELGLCVVKVLVPGIERYSFKITCIGRRAHDMYHKEYGRPLQI